MKRLDARQTLTEQDTVFIAHAVLRWSGHVEQDKLGLLGLLYDDLVKSYSCVHAPHIHLVSMATKKQAQNKSFFNKNRRPARVVFVPKISTHKFSHSLQQRVGWGTLVVNNAHKSVLGK